MLQIHLRMTKVSKMITLTKLNMLDKRKNREY